MSTPIEIGNVIDANASGPAEQPPTGGVSVEAQALIDALTRGEITPEAAKAKMQSGDFVAPTVAPPPVKPVNKYAPTGWRKKISVEFDLTMPSGQNVRIRRLEKNDLFRLKIMDHLDDLLPLLIDSDMDDAEKDAKLQEAVKNNKNLIDNMYSIIDVVVMACCVNPMVCADPSAALYGSDEDLADPNFIAVVHIDDIDMDERQQIFSAAFGSDAAHLKSLRTAETPGVESVSTVESVLLPSERNS